MSGTELVTNAAADPLRIVLVAPPYFDIPPKGYGGTEAVVADLAGLALGALVVALLALAGVAVFATAVEAPLGVSQRLLARAGTLGAVYGGLALIALAVLVWFRRYEAVHTGGELIAGAGRATRDVGIPTTTVAAVVIGLVFMVFEAFGDDEAPEHRGEVPSGPGAGGTEEDR